VRRVTHIGNQGRQCDALQRTIDLDTLVTRRRSIGGLTLFVAAALIASVAWADQFRHLTASEIRAQVVGKRITDDGHWSQIFERSGRLVVNDLGHPSTGSWSVKNDKLCILRPAVLDACYEIWLSGNEVQLRVPGSNDAMTVYLRPAGGR
jgi:hypothetical protein